MVIHKEVFKATITVEGKVAETGQYLQRETRTVYTDSFKDMLDELVQESVSIYNHVTERVNRTNYKYNPKDDQWQIVISYPDVAKKATTSPYKTDPRGLRYSHPKETALEGRILEFKDIVRFAVLARHLRIVQLASYLLLARAEKSEISEIPKKPFQGIDNASSIQDMTSYGFQGDDLLFMLMTAMKEFRVVKNGKIASKPKKQT